MSLHDQKVYNSTSEELVTILCSKTQNSNPLFFRVLVAYYFSLIASTMRCTIATHDRGDIPVNLYALNLSPSGSGKGFSTNIIEGKVINLFRQRFLDETFPFMAGKHLPQLAIKRANRKSTDPDEELVRAEKEFEQLGPLVFTFDSGTPAAVKQMRHKLLMAQAGSVNLQIDEIGSNLLGNIDVLNTFLELYDMGFIKQKLIKNTSDNLRNEEITGKTPTNMMLFGTPGKLLNGSKTEEELYSMLETGYARRCFFGYSRNSHKVVDLSPEEVYKQLTEKSDEAFLNKLSARFESLADMVNMDAKLSMTKDTSLKLIAYRIKCEKEASNFAEHDEIKKAEISHRYFKALKLAGAYAFVEGSGEVTEAHLDQAITLAEESGEAFSQLLTRDRSHVKLAKYISTTKREVTHADLVEDLPFYRGAQSQKQEMLALAIAYGYRNNIIIKKSFSDGIEFLRGESLEATDVSKMIVSYSKDIVTDFVSELAPFDKLHVLTQASNLHWVNHHLTDGYRNEENCVSGFNMVVLDIDGGVKIETARALLSSYKYLLYTTKRHTNEEHRFRIVMPISHKLRLDAKEFKEFMSNIYEWLPFDVDLATNQRARKWLSFDGYHEYNDGELLDVLPFIPKTTKNEERKNLLNTQQSMNNLERWVINNIGDGNRNNMLLRYAMILMDGGFDFEGIRLKVFDLNEKIPDKLDQAELLGTVMVTVGKQLSKRP